MKVYNKILCALIFVGLANSAFAQSDSPVPNINSPYSMYGFGSLKDKAFAKGKAMGGVGYALQDPMEINVKNPASYSAVDSLTMLIDVGMSMYGSTLSDGNTSVNAKNAAFDYVALQFRMAKGLGLTVAYTPFSSVGYNFYTSQKVNAGDNSVDFGTNTYSYSGNGGLQEAMVGIGYSPFRGFSFGANASFLYGSINRYLSVSSSNTSSYGFTKTETFTVKDYRLDFGLQYKFKVKDKHMFALGLTYSYGHEIGADAYISYVKTSSSSVSSYSQDTLFGGMYLPHMYGGGILYQYDDKLTLTADYSLQKWSENKFLGSDILLDRREYRFGAEYIHDADSKNYFSKIKYRLGGYYSEPYIKINGYEGAREYGVSVGLALPVLYNKTMVQVSGQYVKVSSAQPGIGLSENMFRLNVGITFNERWFMKQKVR